MWEWFMANCIWIIIVATVVLILVLVIGDLIQNRIEKSPSKSWHGIRHKGINLSMWSTGGIILVIIVLAVVALVLSRQGIHNLITPETVEQWSLEHGINILIIVLVGAGLWLTLNKFLPPLVGRTMVRTRGESKEGVKKRTDTLTAVLTGTGKVLIVIVVLFMVLSELDVPIGPILAGFGVAGIAVGFGAQYLIRDLIAGIFILLENQYRVGDVAKVADTTGLVEEVNLRKTVLRDMDGIVHHIPNGEIKVASNYTRHFARVNLDISVAYGTDLDYAISVINHVGQELSEDENWGKLIKTAPQVLRVNNFGDSGIDIKILGDVKPLQQWAVMGELRLRLKKAFDEAGIEIPWPHVKLYYGQSRTDDYVVCKACSHPNQPGNRFCFNCGSSLISP